MLVFSILVDYKYTQTQPVCFVVVSIETKEMNEKNRMNKREFYLSEHYFPRQRTRRTQRDTEGTCRIKQLCDSFLSHRRDSSTLKPAGDSFSTLKMYPLLFRVWRRERGSRSDKRKSRVPLRLCGARLRESGSRNVQPAPSPASFHLNSFPVQSSDHRLIYRGSYWSSLRFVYVGKAWRRSMKSRSRFSHVGGRERVTQAAPAAGLFGLEGNPYFMQLRPNPPGKKCS